MQHLAPAFAAIDWTAVVNAVESGELSARHPELSTWWERGEEVVFSI